MFHRKKRRYRPLFCPAKPVPSVIRASQAISGLLLEKVYACEGLDIRHEELERLHALLAANRIVFVCNHPNKADPAVMFRVSALLNEQFYYLSNREQFDRTFGLYGHYLQACGAYSIMRGVNDTQSFSFTSSLLSNGTNKLVVFPEGGNYSWNDMVSPFQRNFFGLMLRALEKSQETPLFIQPVALKYNYMPRSMEQVDESLSRIEEALSLKQAGNDFRLRIQNIGNTILDAVEIELFGQVKGGDLYTRVDNAREEMLKRACQMLGRSYPEPGALSLVERTRPIFDTFYSMSFEGTVPKSDYELKLLQESAQAMLVLRKGLDRLSNWMALKPGYLSESPTAARKVEITTRLEREVLKHVLIKPLSKCTVRFGIPFDLRECLGARLRDAAEQATRRAEVSVQRMLDEMTTALVLALSQAPSSARLEEDSAAVGHSSDVR